MLAEDSIAAATAVVGYNLLVNDKQRQSGRPRVIRSIALAGSAAALDTKVDVFVGNRFAGSVYNKATGAPLREHRTPIGAYVPAGEEVSMPVVDAPATNPINYSVDFKEY